MPHRRSAPSSPQVAAALTKALRQRGVQFRYVRPVPHRGWRENPPTGFYVIDGQALAPYQAADAYLPGGWRGFYAQVMGGGR